MGTLKGVSAPVRKGLSSFTLVELLVVMFIISLLAALSLAAGTALWSMAARKRAMSEIQAMSAANEGYKADNGIYAQGDGVLLTNSATTPYSSSTLDGTSTEYQTNSQLLYQALSGQTNYLDVHVVGAKTYMAFKINQLGNNTAPAGTTGAGSTFIRDPWNYSYGYSTGTTNNAPTPSYPFNGSGFFDLWSTAGVTVSQMTTTPALTNKWVSNWTQ